MFNELERRYMDDLTTDYAGWVSGYGVSVPTLDEANLVTSAIEGEEDAHYILLDLDDIGVELVESSTPGHHHLYIYHKVTLDQLTRLMTLLNEMGIIQDGIMRGLKERGRLCLRKPGVVKGVETP